jgi:hypothetical protein
MTLGTKMFLALMLGVLLALLVPHSPVHTPTAVERQQLLEQFGLHA